LGGLSAAGERTGVSSKPDSSPPQIEYIPRQLLKTMRQYGLATEDIRAMDNMIEVYDNK